MSEVKPHLYINSRGQFVTRHSYSGSESFSYCARKYYLERVQGWGERQERSSKFFGVALEAGWTYWHQHNQDTAAAVAHFVRLWAEHKDKPYLYNKTDVSWDVLNLDGQELIKLYALKYSTFPYVVNNPLDFQVETNFEVFPGSKLAGIAFTSYIDCMATLKESGEPLIIDCKTSGKEVPEFTVLDPQLRSYAWVKNLSNVSFLWFRKMGRTISKGDPITILEPCGGLNPGDDAVVLAKDILGGWVVVKDPNIAEKMDTLFIGKSKAVEEARAKYVTENGVHIPEKSFTKQRIYFKTAVITPESAEDIGRAIKRDIINIVNANEKNFWPMQSGVRFPNEKCPSCPMRGICANRPELRDQLLIRKQEELDFNKEEE